MAELLKYILFKEQTKNSKINKENTSTFTDFFRLNVATLNWQI